MQRAPQHKSMRTERRTHATDRHWELFGQNDPYFAVIPHADFARARLNDASLVEFFESGRRYMDFVVQVVRERLDPDFKPARSLDFGCGVGRLTIPIASISQMVTAVDVSESMLREAKLNCEKASATNVEFLPGDDHLSAVQGKYDFVNSFIVLQHIPKRRGEVLFKRLVDILPMGGIGVLHVTYANPVPPPKLLGAGGCIRGLAGWVFERNPVVFGLWNLFKGRPFSHKLERAPQGREPRMLMERYNLNRLFEILQELDCPSVFSTFTNHSGHLGVILFFQRERPTLRE
jgi:SAM-dependent methyltransferase